MVRSFLSGRHRRRPRRGAARPSQLAAGGLLVLVLLAPTVALAPASGQEASCDGLERINVPGAEVQKTACLDDLTTAGTSRTGHTNSSDWSGLHAGGTVNPTNVPGVQVDGYFPDDSSTNTNNGWNHDAQFVIRLPDTWNGGLVITGAPGVRRQYANDFIISDWVLDRGYAFAATDKGNTGTSFYHDGTEPGDAILEWHARVTELTRAARAAVAQRYGREPRRVYAAGISNGGYLVRWALENHPRLYDGGLDWEGTLFRADGPNLLTYLPVTLEHFPTYRATGEAEAHRAILAAGFAAGSEFLWDYHYAVYWDLTQRIYREELDPDYDGLLDAGIPFCQSGTPSCDADYDYFSRPPEVHRAVERVSLSGRIGKPVVTLHGTLDSLLPERDSRVYADLVSKAGRSKSHRYYVVEAGNHVDSLYDNYPDRLRPILPCSRAAFIALERWVERGTQPPASQVLARPGDGGLNHCEIGAAGYSSSR